MNKVGFFQSIRLKFIIIYILLLLLAIQVIGVYFAQQLEENLMINFQNSINERLELLSYNLEQAMTAERTEEGPTLQQDVQNILFDFDSNDIAELQVIDNKSRIIGTTNQLDQNLIGKRITEYRIKRTLLLGSEDVRIMLERERGDRTLVMSIPIYRNQEIIGAIYLEATLEGIYDQLDQINQIFANGTILAITISALVGVLVARTITKPIAEMRKQSQLMAKGDFTKKVKVYGNDEIGQLAVSVNDLNDQLRRAQATTEGERQKLSSVLSNMTDGVIATDRKGNVILMNEPASRLIGYDFEEVKGKNIIDVLDLTERIKDIGQLHKEGVILIDFSDENQDLILRSSFSIVLDENETVDGFITVLSDVTEQEKVEQERREFVANVSHELRTPLTTMKSYLEALTDGAWQDQEIAPRFLKVTQNETERMIRLVNDLLQLSKMDNKEHRFTKQRVNMVPFIHSIIDRFEIQKHEHIVFKREIEDEPIYVEMDPDKITQVFDNILSNAIKYSPEGGTIVIKTHNDMEEITISVTDEGVGIPKGKVSKIFERFYRVDKARSRNLGGTGLGLAIAKEMIDAHHGHIWATSKEGQGTTIIFTLPVSKWKRGKQQ
ncbi:cell wall metabolism sensor histidine kinase WalK [Bacillaceae bacterium S4-13-56]